MEFNILTSEDFQTNCWSGGTTRELFIFPPESTYQQRNFLFRLSTATVETEKSEFTFLPGVARKLLILSGAIKIQHQNRQPKPLKPLDVATFSGDWKTTSFGQCTDFNLMTNGETQGKLLGKQLTSREVHTITIPENTDWFFVFVAKGKVDVEINKAACFLKIGDLLVVSKPEPCLLELRSLKESTLVVSEIWLGEQIP